jgi:hypothetical protein
MYYLSTCGFDERICHAQLHLRATLRFILNSLSEFNCFVLQCMRLALFNYKQRRVGRYKNHFTKLLQQFSAHINCTCEHQRVRFSYRLALRLRYWLTEIRDVIAQSLQHAHFRISMKYLSTRNSIYKSSRHFSAVHILGSIPFHTAFVPLTGSPRNALLMSLSVATWVPVVGCNISVYASPFDIAFSISAEHVFPLLISRIFRENAI